MSSDRMDACLKGKVLEATLARIDSENIQTILAEEIEKNFPGRTDLFTEFFEELEGFGPFNDLLLDPEISEILANSPTDLYFEKNGGLQKFKKTFHTRLTYERFIKRILLQMDKVADRRNPIVDGVLSDGTRVHIVLPPISQDSTVSLRRHRHSHWTLKELALRNFLGGTLVEVLREYLLNKKNILICGPTGVGKTTLLRALLLELSERVITIEDTTEIGLKPHQGVSLVTRLCSDGLVPSINLSELVKHSLRMRPDRIVIGEIRGPEALVFLDAVSTGHKGSMSSIHASSCRQALTRLESLVSRGAPQWPISVVRQMIFESVDVIICVGKKQQCRQITEISEIAGIENFGILLHTRSY